MSWHTVGTRIGLAVLALAATILIAGAAAQHLLARADAHRFPAPGRLLDLGGRKLHLQCAGEGAPTVFVELGAGEWGLAWTDILHRVASTTRICLYDRAGYGWSDAVQGPRDPDALLADLRAAIRGSGAEGPVVLVGHSLGGLLTRLYQRRYPDEVAGMALVESAHPRQWQMLPPEIWRTTRRSAAALARLAQLGRFGVLRLMVGRLATQRVPESVRAAYRATAVRPSALATLAREILASESLAEQVDRAGPLGDLPLAVVSAGRSFDAFRAMAPDWPFDRAEAAWASLQRDLVGLSSNARQYVSAEATHNVQADDPQTVATALVDLVHLVRSPAP